MGTGEAAVSLTHKPHRFDRLDGARKSQRIGPGVIPMTVDGDVNVVSHSLAKVAVTFSDPIQIAPCQIAVERVMPRIFEIRVVLSRIPVGVGFDRGNSEGMAFYSFRELTAGSRVQGIPR